MTGASNLKRFSICVGIAICLCCATVVSADKFTDEVRKDTEWLAGYPSRVPGTPGHAKAQNVLLKKVREIAGDSRVWTQEFPVIVPVTRKTELVVTDGAMKGTHKIHAIWPDLVRLKTTPEAGIAGDLAYVGSANLAELPARSLRGRIAVMEMASYENYRRPFSMGAVAVLLLGGRDDRALQPAQQPLYKPRYYVPEGELADALRKGEITSATIHCDGEWQTTTARNICALVRPATETAAQLPPIAVAVPYDSMSIVMGLAPGADNAVDAAILLGLLREAATTPPNRAILFCFVDAYGINQLGMRHLLSLLRVGPDDPTREDYAKLDTDLLKDYQELAEQVEELGDGPDALEKLWNKMEYRDLQRCVKDVVAPEVVRLNVELGELRLAVHKLGSEIRLMERDQKTADPDYESLVEQKEAAAASLAAKEARLGEVNGMVFEMITKAPLDPTTQSAQLAIWHTACTRVRGQLEELQQHSAKFEKLDKMRDSILAEMHRGIDSPLPLSYLLGIDVSDAGFSVGAALSCRHLLNNEARPAIDFVRWLKKLMKSPDDPFWKSTPAASLVINSESILGHEDPTSFNVGKFGVGLLSSPAASYQLPAATWATLDGLRVRVDTPQDSLDRLDWARLSPQIDVTHKLFSLLFNDIGFAPEFKSKGRSNRPKWRIARGAVVTESVAETVPRTPMVGTLTVLVGGSNNGPGPEGADGIRRHEFVRTGADGVFRFPPMAGQANRNVNNVRVKAFVMDERGRIVQAISDSVSMIAGRVSSSIRLEAKPSSGQARVVAFECRELNGPEFFDPRFLEPLSQFSLSDVTRGGTPKRYHFSVHQGQMFGLVQEHMKWQLILRAGTAANRLALLNLDPDFPAKKEKSLRAALQDGGYGIGESLPSIPSHIAARDFFTINEWRLASFRKVGVSSKVIDELHETTKEMLAAADKSLDDDDGGALHRTSASALANEIRAYEAVRAMGDDVTRGGIFLMILIVPFAVAMERLLFAWRGIGQRIITSVSIFAGMTAILWSFHPSFRITTQPMIIVMSFAILALSMLVIIMILRKFEADMEEMRRGHAEASGAQTSRGGVIGSAIWLGIGNMRKRKLRTTLTATTIVLITFALLCFSSSTHYQNRRQFNIKNVDAPSPGVLMHQPNMRAMDQRSLSVVGNLLEGKNDLLARYWHVKSDPTTWRLHARNPVNGKQVSLKAGLGLMAAEKDVSDADRFFANWERFTTGKACYLSEGTARNLGAKPGDSVLVGGMTLELAGVFDSAKLEMDWKMIDGQSMLPYDYTKEQEERRAATAIQTEMSAGIGLTQETATEHVGGDEVVILPAELALSLGGQLRSLAIPAQSRDDAEQIALTLMKVLAFPMYYGEGTDVKVVVATPLIPKPPRNLLIPLIIAALIIFNTMLNSVAERKKEIHIYTSLGLAPRHVGMLFLAESATYGLMGSVFGYVVGQGFAKILTELDLMGGITLNYSGSNVVMTMGMVMAVVLLSAIVPAIMAGKLATPSKDMKWSVPEPEDGVIKELLPFTVTRSAAGGLVAFIHEFMEAHADGGIGTFTADDVALLPPSKDYVVGLSATTWLAPYDLGVRQRVEIEVYEDIEDICNIRVNLVYGSGQTKTWWRLNSTFLDELRRQLLGWRNIKSERMMRYIAQATGVVPEDGQQAEVRPDNA